MQTLYSLAEVAPHPVLRVAVVSLAERLCFGLVADPAAVPDIAGLAAAIQQEAAELAAAAET
jgi:diacylglycerol O-acyltransferase / wax synthase